ncbi:hypothetical protein [Pseudescherichia vulneris]|uniref:hypothetical protein n=1 Tax=Pseudescherichia vulneris TaxID=566 RepID=UPI0028D1D389|nr:hypothetical protein [Pseudescherichia vulneris]
MSKINYSDVETLIDRIDQRLTTRRSLVELRSRFKKQGKTAEVDAITEALRRTDQPAYGIMRQNERLQDKLEVMDPTKALELKAAVNMYTEKNRTTHANLQVSVALAYQGMFESRGVSMDYEETMSLILLNAAEQFERLTGSLPVLID